MGNPKRKPVVPARNFRKGACNHLSKQFKCSHRGQNNHMVKNCFALHSENRHYFEREKTLEAKIGSLKERFKNLA